MPAIDELTDLRRRVAQVKEHARKNEDAWKRAQTVEMGLLEADGLDILLERLTEGLRVEYQLAAVTLALVDPDHQIRHLLLSQGAKALQLPGVSFIDSLKGWAPQLENPVRPWLGPFQWPDHALLAGGRRDLRSLALLPLSRGKRVIGSLNFGSDNPARFTRTLATDFLNHLAVIAAFSLENSINRARLVLDGFTDVLTGWHNRRYLQTRLHEEVARSRRDRVVLACLMMDIDHFKRINDGFGHPAGDEVLSLLAQRVDRLVRGSDVSARYGGEEFVVLMPGGDLAAAQILAERVRRAIAAEPFRLRSSGQAIAVSVSIGVAQYQPAEDQESLEAAGERLIANADAALYEAKKQGRNKVVLAGVTEG